MRMIRAAVAAKAATTPMATYLAATPIPRPHSLFLSIIHYGGLAGGGGVCVSPSLDGGGGGLWVLWVVVLRGWLDVAGARWKPPEAGLS
jgi:hypothetical protein